MTAEIAIMNKEAVALASDSAVTITSSSGQKIFTSANKLFALSKYHAVGIMMYGNAVFMGIPWETIIKTYRNSLNKNKFDTLEEYANKFIAFLDDGNALFSETVQEEYFRNFIYIYLNFLKKGYNEKVSPIFVEKKEVSIEEVTAILSKIIDDDYDNWEKTDNIPSIPKEYINEVLDKYVAIIDKAIEDVFEKAPISENHLIKLKRIVASLFSKFPQHISNADYSGIVIAGFGEKEIFPSLKSFVIEGIVNNKLKYREDQLTKIGLSLTPQASITPFAQRDMVSVFMEGIAPSYNEVQQTYISKIFDEYTQKIITVLEKYTDKEKRSLKDILLNANNELLAEYSKKMNDYRRGTYVDPVINVVAILPKDELAAMAESLVNLTSFKRKVTMEPETVSGPIDVAVISKGDGFIWIKRKHYFKAEQNPQFFANYYPEG